MVLTKLCECGCGQPTKPRVAAKKSEGHIKGEPTRFLNRHNLSAARAAVGVAGHTEWRTKTHMCWRSMIKRCTQPNRKDWKYYGGRGITVCERWMVFANFLADLGEKPDGLSIDRINNDGNYEPGNCRWATRYEQALNRRKKYARKKLPTLEQGSTAPKLQPFNFQKGEDNERTTEHRQD